MSSAATGTTDKEALVAIVKDMSKSMTGARSTSQWAEDALWFDIPPFASRGIPPAVTMFDKAFSNFESYESDFLETSVVVSGDMGIVCTIQRLTIALKNGNTQTLLVRETDCFEKRDERWQLIHQHASVPTGGEWDGKVITA
jgi:ketosteroid isomerase-like protein